MAGRPRKPGNALVGHRKIESPPDLRVLATSSTTPAGPPPLPPGRWLAVTRERWATYWRSPIAWNTDRECDDPVILRWVTALDQWERAVRALRKAKPIIPGSMGQDRLNPLVGYIAALEKSMRAEERHLGIGALNRAILGRMVPPAYQPDQVDDGDDLDDFADDDPAASVTWVER